MKTLICFIFSLYAHTVCNFPVSLYHMHFPYISISYMHFAVEPPIRSTVFHTTGDCAYSRFNSLDLNGSTVSEFTTIN